MANLKKFDITALKDTGEHLISLNNGAFFTTKSGQKVNVMVVSWGSVGQLWGKPVLTAMIRKSRFTHELLEQTGEFTLTIPSNPDKNITAALGICGSKSGRHMDKVKETGLTLMDAKSMDTPIIQCPAIHFECKLIYKNLVDPAHFAKEYSSDLYADEDYHTLYFGEIIETYVTE